jgi:hypothetical protein
MFRRIRYDRLTDQQLREQQDAWFADLDEWHGHGRRFGDGPAVRRGLKRCLRHIDRIERVARRRGVRL